MTLQNYIECKHKDRKRVSGVSPESLYLYLVDKISGIMLQMFEKDALNLFHCSGGSFAACHPNDM